MATNPTFTDVVNLLERLVNNDPHLDDGSPHQGFWRNVSEAQFLEIRTDAWGLEGRLIVPGNPGASALYQSIAGARPFDGSDFQQMPDTARARVARIATPEEILLIRTYIQNLRP
jgi:hypothetical protein